MRNYLELGTTPADEECAQVGSEGYAQRAMAEANRFIELLKKKFGEPPEGGRLRIKSSPHDFGVYYDVVAEYDETQPKALDWAWNMEANLPRTWE